MNKDAIIKRLKSMEREKCEIMKMEIDFVRKFKKFLHMLNKMKKIINKKNHELSLYKNEVENLEHYIKELKEFVQAKDEDINKLQEQLEKLQIEEDEKHLITIDQIRSLKEITKTYINFEALPDHVQGTIVKETTEGDDEWHSFRISTAMHTEDEIQKILAELIEYQSPYKEQWDDLILGVLRESK
uniref:Kinetochore protein Spc24 n=1 Tax=Glossina brevipalpis TaxID=37001 RepID=A0A1A9WHT2_9MUSC